MILALIAFMMTFGIFFLHLTNEVALYHNQEIWKSKALKHIPKSVAILSG